MATIDDFGGSGQALNNPPLGGPTGWAAAVRDFLRSLEAGLPQMTWDVVALPAGDEPTISTVTVDDVTTVTIGVPAGATGPAPALTIGTITTLTPGASATLTLTETSPGHYRLDGGIPQGATGGATLGGLLTTKGDLAVGQGSGVATRLAAGADESILTADSAATTGVKWAAPTTARSGKNLFDPAAVIVGTGINGAFADYANANSAMSGLITIPAGAKVMSVSGLSTYTGSFRYLRWKDSGGTTLTAGVPGTSLAWDNTTVTERVVPIPAGAVSVQIGLYLLKTAGTVDLYTIQVQFGGKTAYEAYTSGVTALNGRAVLPLGARTPVYVAGGRNLLDPATICPEIEVLGGTGAASYQSPSSTSAVMLPIPAGVGALTFSGLPTYAAGSDRNVAFFDSSRTLLRMESVPKSSATVTLPVPLAADYMNASLVQRKTSAEAVDLSTVQIEAGSIATPYAAYSPVLAGSDGYTYAYPRPRTQGLSMVCFGDSITATSTWDTTTGAISDEYTRSNWPRFAARRLQLAAMFNYAASGARITAATGLTDAQKGPKQIEAAIAANRRADIVVYALGTNSNDTAGSYATAMGKATLGDLDQTLIYEALRWSFWTIRTQWPTARCFAWLPPQTAADDMLTAVTRAPIQAMALRYGFTIVDAAGEAGIVKDFEVVSSAGRDLSDGLHPNVQGQTKLAELMSSKILAAFGSS